MLSFDEVLECHMVGGGFDYLMKVRVKDMVAFRRFLQAQMGSVKNIQHTRTYFVMKELKATHKMVIGA
jgi:Lrp/AsnC family leucine-responsive transcriptional regulator